MAIAEDPAFVLEQFIQDVANLPAEITHLYEEMQAKDVQIQECRTIINQRDASLQKFIKLNGSLVKNPKEEPYSKTILEKFDKAEILQAEKLGLAEKAAALLDRHVKRLDVKIRDLQKDGSIPLDPTLPSLLQDSPGNLVGPASSVATGANTPLNPLSGNTSGGAANIANAAIARIASATGQTRLGSPGVIQLPPNQMLQQAHLANAANIATMSLNGRNREMSVGSDTKRRRLNTQGLGSLPAQPSNLARQSSLGPGTPKPSTPGSRAGSVGPKIVKKPLKKGLSSQQLRKMATKSGMKKKSARRSLMGSSRASPSTTADDESALDSEGSDDETMSGTGGDGAGDEDGMDVEDDGDDTKYCFCKSVSYGDMVACDNDNCPYQWFHWDCVGLKEEPVGDWLCPECRGKDTKRTKKRP